VAWPLYAVIASAALLGSVVVALMMRSSSTTMTADAANAAKLTALELPPRASAGMTVVPISEPDATGEAAVPPGAGSANEADPGPGATVAKGSGHTAQPVEPPARSPKPLAKAPGPPRRPGTTVAATASPRSSETTTMTPAQAPARE